MSAHRVWGWPLLSARHLSEADCGHRSGVQCRQGISPSQVRSRLTTHTAQSQVLEWLIWFGLGRLGRMAGPGRHILECTPSLLKSESLTAWLPLLGAPGPGAEEGNTGDKRHRYYDADLSMASSVITIIEDTWPHFWLMWLKIIQSDFKLLSDEAK